MPACKHCGAPTVVDDAGVVCTNCAELAEPSLIVLTSDIDYPAATTYDGWNPVSLKTVRTGRNRYLSGQGKEVRDNKNLDDMHWFIKNLARAAFVSGTTERAYHLFAQAMKSGQYRWGRTAKLVAGACISIALRETNRPEMFPDLALLLSQKILSLTRAFSSVVLVLELKLPSSEPKSHVSSLQAHLSAALEDSAESDIPPSVIAAIRPLPSNAVLVTATSLSDLLASSDPPSALARLPAPPTACAVLIWAIEAEARTTLALSDLAAFLGSKCNVSRPIVMSRYKVIQDELIERIDNIDWLDHYDPSSGKRGRAKISRRMVVARGLKAAIDAERECRREKLNAVRRPDRGGGEGGESDSDDPQSAAPESRPRKRRRLHALQEATRFLLNPLSGALPASFFTTPSSTRSLPLPTYLLTSSLSMRRDKLPSRLQLLSVTRGGVSPDEIEDDELFDEGELENIMRTENEVAELRNILGWDDGPEEEQVLKDPPKPRKRATKGVKTTTSSRLIPEAVASYFAEEKSDCEFGGLLRLDSDDPTLIIEDDAANAFIGLRRTLVPSVEDECPFSRSPSPEPEPDDRYAQECD